MKRINYNMNELELELLFTMQNEIMPKVVKSLGKKIIDETYFKNLGLLKKVYENAGYDLALEFCDYLESKGMQKTHLNFEKMSRALKAGKEKGEFFISLAKDGREYLEMISKGENNIL